LDGERAIASDQPKNSLIAGQVYAAKGCSVRICRGREKKQRWDMNNTRMSFAGEAEKTVAKKNGL